jgi:hypothetical protein
MKLGKVAFVGTVFLLLAMARAMAEESQRRYVETHGERTQVVQYGVVRSADGLLISSVDPRSTETGRWVTGTGLVTWQQVIPSIGNNLSGRRSGNVITLTGTLGGKQVFHELRVDNAPWYQIFGPAMADLLPPDAERQEFWVVSPVDLSVHKMMVRRAGRESIDLKGVKVPAERIHFSPAGVLAPLWGADFWYRASDALWIFSRLPEDGGITVSTIETLPGP